MLANRSPFGKVLVAILFAHTLPSIAAEERTVPSTIKEVTIYLTGAQVTRTASVNIPAGTSVLRFVGLSAEADPGSIQVTGTGAFTVMRVKHRLAQGALPHGTPAIKTLEQGIKEIERRIQDEQTRIGLLQNEEQRLLKNETIESGDRGLSVEQLRAINDYHRERMAAVRNGAVNGQRQIEAMQDEAQELHMQLQKLQGVEPESTSEVLVEVNAERAVSSTFTLRYVVSSAGWSPQYDLRVPSVAAPLELVYKAQVYQSTGEDWTDVRIELSSGEPGTKFAWPEMAVWRLGPGSMPPAAIIRNDAFDPAVREVHGVIRDASSGEPLPFVNVVLKRSNGSVLLGTTSNVDGYYTIAVPAEGRSLTFKFIGYSELTSSIAQNTMNVALQQNMVELSAVEVVAYKRPLIERDAGAATMISKQDIQRMPARRNANSVATTLRGAKAESSYVYVDGVPASYGDVTGGVINTSIRRQPTLFALLIDTPYSIPSDGQAHSVTVKEHTLESTYRYYCTPKLDVRAFLVAKAIGWDELDLLPGPANLFFESTFIGETYLDTRQVGDTLDIPLGPDRSVVVTRTRNMDLTARTFSSSKRIENLGWRIDVRNMKAASIDLVITDQVPVPMHSDISVDLGAYDATELNTEKGFLTWRLAIPAHSSSQHGFTYAVKAPKQMQLVLE